MSLWRIAWRSIQQRSLASALTALSVGLGVALVVAVLVIHRVVDTSFRRGAGGYDLIIGPKQCSDLELVLATVFHLNLSRQLGTISQEYYEEFVSGRFAGVVEAAVPICLGHDYKGLPAVATTPEMFEKLTYLDEREYRFAQGNNFCEDHFFEAVVGSTAAQQLGLKLGDRFRPVATRPEAAGNAPGEHGHEEFTVVGILEPTGTPNDRVLFMNIEGFWRCPAHTAAPSVAERLLSGPEAAGSEGVSSGGGASAAAQPEGLSPAGAGPAGGEPAGGEPEAQTPAGGEPEAQTPAGGEPAHSHQSESGGVSEPAAETEHQHKTEHDDEAHGSHDHAEPPLRRGVTAILVRTDQSSAHAAMLAMALPDRVNREKEAQAVRPAAVIVRFFDTVVGNLERILLFLAVLVVIVAGIGIMVSMYNSMSERRHEIAVMRALGARRGTVMAIILTESILLALGGGALGVVLGHGLVGVLGPSIRHYTGVIVSPLDFQVVELVLVPGLIVLATLVGYLPAVVAYRTDVARSLLAAA